MTHSRRPTGVIFVGLFVVAGVVVFAGAVVYPSMALIARCIIDAAPPSGGFAPSWHLAALLWRSVWMACVAATGCLMLAIPIAFALGRGAGRKSSAWIAALLVMVLLCPPMVLAFSWERLLPPSTPATIRCLLVWTLWAWPIPAAVLASGWVGRGWRVYESALLDVSPVKAMRVTLIQTLLPHAALAWTVLFLLFTRDYAVPHASGLLVFATAMLSQAESSALMIDAAWSALPSVALTLGVVVALRFTWRRTFDRQADLVGACPSGSSRWVVVVLVCVAVSWIVPIGAMIARLGSALPMAEALRTYGGDLSASLGTALLAAIVVVATGLGVNLPRRLRAVACVWSLVFGALPGALIGVTLVAAYNNHTSGWVYDHWPIVSIAYVARFAWVGVLIGAMVMSGRSGVLAEQARVDGAGEGRVWSRVLLPPHLPLLGAAVFMVTALSVSDVSVSSLVRVPDFNPIAHVVIEKFHRFEDGMLVSLSLWLVCAGLPASIMVFVAKRRSTAGVTVEAR